MTVQEPKVLGYTTAGWESACGFKSMHPGAAILRGVGVRPTLFIVNRAFLDLWMENRAALPGEELNT